MINRDRCGQTWRLRHTVMLVIETSPGPTDIPNSCYHRVLIVACPNPDYVNAVDWLFEDEHDVWEDVSTWERLA